MLPAVSVTRSPVVTPEHEPGLVGYPFAPSLTFNELNYELGLHSIAALVWLAAGVVSTAGGGDANWLRQFDPF